MKHAMKQKKMTHNEKNHQWIETDYEMAQEMD